MKDVTPDSELNPRDPIHRRQLNQRMIRASASAERKAEYADRLELKARILGERIAEVRREVARKSVRAASIAAMLERKR